MVFLYSLLNWGVEVVFVYGVNLDDYYFCFYSYSVVGDFFSVVSLYYE